jgi:hypothetical protein
METLVYELSKLIDTVSKLEPVKRTVTPPREQPPPAPPEDDLPPPARSEQLKKDALVRELIDKMKIRDDLHAGLNPANSLEVTRYAALQILELSEQITAGYERIDVFTKHGILPNPTQQGKRLKEKIPVSDLSKTELYIHRANARSHISRLRAAIKNPDKVKTIHRNMNALQIWTDRLNEINATQSE